MSLLDTILNNSGAVSQLAKSFNLGEGEVTEVIKNVAPALSQGLQQNTQRPGGLDSLVAALEKGSHSRYLDEPSVLAEESAREDGNNILGHILGNKEVSRKVASHASNNTGVGSDIVEKLLPMVASLAMGALSKQKSGITLQAGASGSIGDVLGSFLGADKDDGGFGDLLGMAGKILGR